MTVRIGKAPAPKMRGFDGNPSGFGPLSKRRGGLAIGADEMASELATAVGLAAAGCSMSSFVPQILKILRERDASAVSTRMYLVTVTGFAAWIAYGLMIGSWPVAGSNLVNLALAGAILGLKLWLGDSPQ